MFDEGSTGAVSGFPDADEVDAASMMQATLLRLRLAVDGPGSLSDAELMEAYTEAEALVAHHCAAAARLLAEVERRKVTETHRRLSTVSWLVVSTACSPRQARAKVGFAGRLAAQPLIAEALGDGRVSVEQAEVLVHGLDRLPDELDALQREQVAAELVGYAAEFGPVGLRRLVNRAVEVVAPEIAEDHDRRSLERTEAQARRERFFGWGHDLDGSLWLRGKLPAVEGEQLTVLLRALATKTKAVDALHGVETAWGQACADALTQVVARYAASGQAPAVGHDRPRILLTLDYATLVTGMGKATLLGSGESISAGQARRLACDAGLLPLVLGGASEPLDVGRERRLFTGGLRATLIRRDQGCVFPGCDRGPADCEAHHIQPWWNGGTTTLSNAALLCPRHHHQIEPNPLAPPHTQWQLRLDARGHPELLTPAGRDGTRTVHQHHRFRVLKT